MRYSGRGCEMVEYLIVVVHAKFQHRLYCGRNYGRKESGIAVVERYS